MNNFNDFAHKALTIIQDIGLSIIAIATVIAMASEIYSMIELMAVNLADLLLLFIYLEVLAMIGIYLESGKLPVRMPLYIAIVALARYLILDMKNMDNWRMLEITGAALIIAITILIIRYGHSKYSYDTNEDS